MLYLLDTCSYLRLAKDVHPLLGSHFLIPPETTQIISEVHTEWSKAPHLQSKFHWVSEAQYSSNRSANLVQLSGKMPTQLFQMRRSLSQFSRSNGKEIKAQGFSIPSSEDCLVLAYVFCLNQVGINAITVSDDGGLEWLAQQMSIPCTRSLGLVHRMFTLGKLPVNKIQSMAAYLAYMNDLPKDWRIQGLSLFGVNIP